MRRRVRSRRRVRFVVTLAVIAAIAVFAVPATAQEDYALEPPLPAELPAAAQQYADPSAAAPLPASSPALEQLLPVIQQALPAIQQALPELAPVLAELVPGQAKKDITVLQAKAILATVRPRDIAGKTRRRIAAE